MSTASQSGPRTTAGRTGTTAVQKAARLVGIVFLAVGVLGFIPGITTGYDTLQFASHHSEAKLLGLFQVSILHNIVHLLFGIVGLVLARTWSGARTYLLGGGAVYLALWILGLVNGASWIPANNADDWLHFGLGVGLIGLGFATTRDARAVRTA